MFDSLSNCLVRPRLWRFTVSYWAIYLRRRQLIDIICLLFVVPRSLRDLFKPALCFLNPFQAKSRKHLFPQRSAGNWSTDRLSAPCLPSAVECGGSFARSKSMFCFSELQLREVEIWTKNPINIALLLFCTLRSKVALAFCLPNTLHIVADSVSMETRLTLRKALVLNTKCRFPPQPWLATTAGKGKKKRGRIYVRVDGGWARVGKVPRCFGWFFPFIPVMPLNSKNKPA